MPFCSCCIRAITSSICAGAEGDRSREEEEEEEEPPWVLFSWTWISGRGDCGTDGRRQTQTSFGCLKEPTLRSSLSFPASKLRLTCTGSGLQQQQEHKRNEKLLSRMQKQTLTHLTEAHIGAVSRGQEGTHGNHGSKNTPREKSRQQRWNNQPVNARKNATELALILVKVRLKRFLWVCCFENFYSVS